MPWLLSAFGGGQICARGHRLCLVVRHRRGHRFPGGLVFLPPEAGCTGHDRTGPHHRRSGRHASFFQKHGTVTKRAAGDILPPFLFRRTASFFVQACRFLPEWPVSARCPPLFRGRGARNSRGCPAGILTGRTAVPSSAARIPPAGGRHPPGCRARPALRVSARQGTGGAGRQERCQGRTLRA